MHPATILAETESRPLVERRVFYVTATDVLPTPLTDARESAGDAVLAPGRHGAMLFSTGTDFNPVVRLRLWSATPPLPGEGWETSGAHVISVPCGGVMMRGMFSVERGSELTVAPGSYWVRASRCGDAERAFEWAIGMASPPPEIWFVDVWATTEKGPA